MKIGYACINTSLSDEGVKSRSLILKTLQSKGWIYYNELVLQNVRDLHKIIKWNEEAGIKAFRISNDIFPHKNQMGSIRDLKYYPLIKHELEAIGDFVRKHDHRISFHADPYCILASQKDSVVKNSLHELDFLGTILDTMGLSVSPYYKINLHIGTFNPSKPEAAKKFIQSFKYLRENTKSRITVENDDSKNGFTVRDLYELVYPHTGIPIVLDYFHHSLNDGGNSILEVSNMVKESWGVLRPMTHHSSSRKLNEDTSVVEKAHADYIYDQIPSDFADVILEAKAKEKAVFKYRLQFVK